MTVNNYCISIDRLAGSGNDTVVFFAGLSGNMKQWSAIIREIEQGGSGRGVIRADPILRSRKFNGRTPLIQELSGEISSDLNELVPQGKFVLAAHSVGAFVALDLASILGDRVSKIVVVNGGLFTVGRFLNTPIAEFFRNPLVCLRALHLFLLAGVPLPRKIKRKIASSRTLSELLLGGLVSDRGLDTKRDRNVIIGEAGSSAIYAALWRNRHHWVRFSSRSQLITQPVTFLVGEQDPIGSRDDAEKMANMLPSSKVVLIPGDGHAMPTESPETVLGHLG